MAGEDVDQAAAAPSGPLAKTGTNSVELAVKGGALVAAGGTALLLSRLRRRDDEASSAAELG